MPARSIIANRIRDVTYEKLRCNASMLFREKNGGRTNPAHAMVPGSAWTWVCIDPKTKFIPFWLIAPRNAGVASAFLAEVFKPGGRQIEIADDNGRIYQPYRQEHSESILDREAMARIFGPAMDDPSSLPAPLGELRSFSQILRSSDPWLATLSSGTSGKVQRHASALALLFTLHNFATVDSATGMSPAMSAGLSNHLWTACEIAGLAGQARWGDA